MRRTSSHETNLFQHLQIHCLDSRRHIIIFFSGTNIELFQFPFSLLFVYTLIYSFTFVRLYSQRRASNITKKTYKHKQERSGRRGGEWCSKTYIQLINFPSPIKEQRILMFMSSKYGKEKLVNV